MLQEGRSASIAMDINHDPTTMDLLDSTGFISACYHATCVKPGGGCLAAPVCSTFVYMFEINEEGRLKTVWGIISSFARIR